jgi:hypothetical protein
VPEKERHFFAESGIIRHLCPDDREQREILKLLNLIGTLGLTVVLSILGFFLLGLWLGRHYGLGNWPMVAGLLLGIGLSFWWVYLRLTRELRRNSLPDEKTGEDKP